MQEHLKASNCDRSADAVAVAQAAADQWRLWQRGRPSPILCSSAWSCQPQRWHDCASPINVGVQKWGKDYFASDTNPNLKLRV